MSQLPENTMLNAVGTTAKMMDQAVSNIDGLLGDGYAASNPVLIAQFMKTCSDVYLSSPVTQAESTPVKSVTKAKPKAKVVEETPVTEEPVTEEPVTEEPVKEEIKTLTHDDLKQACLVKAREDSANRDKLKSLLASYGASKAVDVPVDKLDEVIGKINAGEF